MFYWSANDFQSKLDEFKTYFNESLVHSRINGKTPVQQAQATESKLLDLREYTWKSHCNGVFELPNAASKIVRHAQVMALVRAANRRRRHAGLPMIFWSSVQFRRSAISAFV